MTLFRYKVKDPLGKLHDGSLEATSADEATQQLRRDGFQVIDVTENADVGIVLFAKRVRKNDILYMTSQLAVMVDAGITISSALDGIAEQEENPTLRRVLDDLRQRVEGGEDFSTALSRHPKHFDKTYVALVRAAEHAGSLGIMLDRIAGYLRKEQETRGKIRGALTYPGVMLVLAIGVTIFLLTYVIPKFTPLFERKGVLLPRSTRLMMALSENLLAHWHLWIVGSLAGAVALFLVWRTEAGRRFADSLRIYTPVLGPVGRKVALSRSIRTLGTMLSSGVPMLDALRLSAAVSGNVHFEKSWETVIDQVTQGNRIAESLHDDPLFPKTLVQMIGAGEESGKLDEVLERVSGHYDREVDMSLKTTTSLIEPLMITAMGFVVGGIGMSLLLPIFTLSRVPG